MDMTFASPSQKVSENKLIGDIMGMCRCKKKRNSSIRTVKTLLK
jgi:hypothetical protein